LTKIGKIYDVDDEIDYPDTPEVDVEFWKDSKKEIQTVSKSLNV
jgi:hypothetical protein